MDSTEYPNAFKAWTLALIVFPTEYWRVVVIEDIGIVQLNTKASGQRDD